MLFSKDRFELQEMRKIEDNDWFYTVLQRYAEWHFVHTYRRIEFVGRENIPTDGVVIYAPNHVNGLMDPIAMLCCNHRPKVFVARADMFRKRLLVPLLRRAKIMPINRIRDGREQVKQNESVIDDAVRVLSSGTDFSIMPEATHRPKHSLLPLGKGVFRIAYKVNEVLHGERRVYILPIGLEYGSYYRYRSTLLVNIGKPLDVTSYIHEHSGDTSAQIYNGLSEQLTFALRGLIWWIPDDDRYVALEEACYLLHSLPRGLCEDAAPSSLQGRLQQKQRLTKRLLAYEEQHPDAAKRLYSSLADIAAERRQHRIVASSLVASDNTLYKRTVVCGIALLLCLPYFVFAALFTSPMWLVLLVLFHFLDDKAFLNSLRYGFVALFLPIVYLVEIVVTALYAPLQLAVVFAVLLLPSHQVFYEYLRHSQRWFSDIRLCFAKDLRRKIAGLSRKDLQND